MPPHDSETTARRVDEMQARLVPEGPAPTGSVVGVVGQSPFRYDWTSPPGAEIRRGRGDPNGSETAPIGTPYTDLDGPTFWLNNDGVQGWTQVGSGAGSGFPAYEDSLYVSTVTILATNVTNIPFDGGGGGLLDGPALLDLTAPAAPTVIADGMYTFSITAITGSILANWGIGFAVRPGGGFTVRAVTQSAAITGSGWPGTPQQYAAATLTSKLAAGDDMALQILNGDASTDGDFQALIQIARIP